MNDTTPSPAQSSGPRWWGIYRAWPSWARITSAVAGAVVLALVVTLGVGIHLYRQPLPQVDGQAALPGLDSAVEVYRDAHGIPQLYGDSDRDLVRAQGYVHAQERFFEMDVRRHATAGRLAELFGPDGLESDKMVRTMGWREIATQELGLVSAETRGVLDAYADGVNAFLKQHEPGDIAVEYTLLGLTGLDYTPYAWSAVDSLAWLKAMAWDLRGNMGDEIARAVAALDNDAETLEALWPAYDSARHAPVVLDAGTGIEPQEAAGSKAAEGLGEALDEEAARTALLDAEAALGNVTELLGTGEGLGSNAWVVSGERTETGAPLLANDPHLGTSQPGIWTQMGLHCRERTPECTLDVAGFTFSGLPGVVIGHNADIAWGFTNLGPDVTDLYLEKVDGDDWIRGGKRRPLEVRTEVIEVRGEDDFELRVRETAHGPLISDVDQEASSVGANAAATDGEEDAYAVALAWTALEPGTTADAIVALNRASNFEEFREGARLFEVPSQNLLYADRSGNIGYQAPGRIPVRGAGHDGRTPVAGWVRGNDWQGFVDFDDLPSVLNPDEGFVVSANQAVVDDDFEHHLTDDWDRGYRSQRIRELLEADDRVSVADMEAIQVDNHNPAAAALVPYLLALDPDDGYVSDGLAELADWDFADDADSGAAAYFNLVWAQVLAHTFDDDLRERVRPTGGSRWVQVVEQMLEDPTHRLWDDRTTEGVETRDDVLAESLLDARDEITRLQSVRPERWNWGRLHRLDLEHQSLGRSGIGVVERLFNRTGYEASGGSNAPNAFAWNAAVGPRVTTAPSMRMVVSLADFDESRWVNLTGVSGHPASPHYDDQTELFVAGESLPWRWSSGVVREEAEERMVLTPRTSRE